MKNLYNAIEQHITTHLPEIAHVDLFNNQIGDLIFDENTNLPFQIPAIFVEFTPIVWEKLSSKSKRGTLGVRIHVLQESYNQSFRGSQDKTAALNILDLIDKVDDVFENFKALNYSAFDGTTTEPDTDHGTIINYIHQYTCAFTKKITAAGKTTSNTAITDIHVEGSINK